MQHEALWQGMENLLLHRGLIFLAHQPARCRVQLIYGAVGLF